MPLLTPHDRISVRPFAPVPSLAGLPSIQRPQASVTNLSSYHEVEEGVDFSEDCFVTKTLTSSVTESMMLEMETLN